MTKKQQIKAVEQALEYLITEGFVVKEGDAYRYKTKKEQQMEMEALLEN
jgi:hypothetical protein